MLTSKSSKQKSLSCFFTLSVFLMAVAFSFLCQPCHAVPLDTSSMESLIKSPEDLVSSDMLRKDPKASLLVLAEARLKQGLWQDAVCYASTLISMDPKNGKAHGILGVVNALAGQQASAKKELTLMNNAADRGLYPDLIKAIVTAREGKIGEAEGYLNAALDKDPGHPVAIYYAGSLSLMQGRIDEAEKAFKNVIAISPDFSAALAGLGCVSVRQEKMQEAVRYYGEALEKEPGNLLYRKELIEIYKTLGTEDAVDREMKMALYYVPGVREARLKQGMGLLTQGEYGEAIRRADSMLSIYKKIPEALYIKAASQINLKDREHALKNVQIFLSQQWGMPQAHHYAGMCYLALGQINEAVKHFRIVIMVDPGRGKSFVPLTVIEQLRGNNRYALQGLRLTIPKGEAPSLIHYLMGHIRMATGDTTGYREEMREAVGLMPGLDWKTDFYVPTKENIRKFTDERNLMIIYFYNGWYGKTINTANTLLKINGNDLFAWYYKALSYVAHRKMKDAIHAFHQLAHIEPNLLAAHMGLGRLYMQTGNSPKAIASFKKVVAMNSEYEPGYVALGDAFAQQREKKQAVVSYRKAIAINPSSSGTYLKLVTMLSGDPAGLGEALQYALKAEQLAPNDPYTADLIGWIYVKQGETKNALEKLQTASKVLPSDPLVQYHLGVAYYKSGELLRAKAAFQEALKISKNFSGSDEAIKMLKEISE